MKVITYTCDRCKSSDTVNKIDLIPIKILLSDHNSAVKQADWCRRCLASYGLAKASEDIKNPIVKIEPPPTIEDIIREIVREEIQS